MKQTTVNECRMIDIRKYTDNRGYLSVVEEDLDGVMALVDREAKLLSGLRSRRIEPPVTHNP